MSKIADRSDTVQTCPDVTTIGVFSYFAVAEPLLVLHFRTFCSSTLLTVRRGAPRVITSNISSFLAGSTTISAQIRNPGEISLKSVYKPFYILYMVILYIIHDIPYICMYGVIYGGHIIYMTFDINPISTLGIDW